MHLGNCQSRLPPTDSTDEPFGKASIKMHDKFGCVLRIKTTTNDVASFKHHRKMERRDGPTTRALAAVKKTIYS